MKDHSAVHKNKVTIVGLGAGGDGLITSEVTQALAKATDVIGYHFYAGSPLIPKGVTVHGSDNRVEIDRAHHALSLAQQGKSVVVVSSGDPGVFAMAAAVFEAFESYDLATRPAVHIEVLPGITAMLAAAARLGAPLGHDFCAINLSDNLKPFAVIEKRVRLALEADFAMAFYNPRSKARPHQFENILHLMQNTLEPSRLISFARAVSTAEERIQTVRLSEATPDMADMRTVVLVGSSQTRLIAQTDYVYTPRSYPDRGQEG